MNDFKNSCTNLYEISCDRAQQLINGITKDDLAECAKQLAMNLANYEIHHGPLSVSPKLTVSKDKSEVEMMTMAIGMDLFVQMLEFVAAKPEENAIN
jgi:hypothetical protein